MSIFMLETDALTSASSAISSLASQVNEVSSSINGYDTSCEDGFDFAGAKRVLASNVEACSTKITNTAVILENVVSAHTELQSSMKFDGSDNNSSSSTSSSGNSSSSDSSSSGGGYSGGGSSGSGGSGSGGSGSGGSGSGGSGNGGSGSESSTDGNSGDDDSNKSSEEEKSDDTSNDLIGDNEEIINADIKSVNYAYINSDKLTGSSKTLFDYFVTYDSNTGYALSDGLYVIACDSSIGEVGDVIKFTEADGSIVECIVGTNTVTDTSKGVINFIVDRDTWANKKPLSFSENLIKNTSVITKGGKVYCFNPMYANTNEASNSSITDVKEV